jgi:hypothetical protein
VIDSDLSLWLLTLLGLLLGVWSIYWTRTEKNGLRVLCGRCLFVLALLELGATALMAALAHSISLAPMGLVSVFLVVAMVWESPAAQWQRE